MRIRSLITMAAVLSTVAGSALAQDMAGSDPAPAFTQSTRQNVEFVPMTRSERLREYLTGTFSLGSLGGAMAHAGLDQWRDNPKEWGSDGGGFAQRFGNAYAKHIIRRTLEAGAAAALHQDDRYFASGETGVWRRTKYAIASTFLARRDDGRRTFAAARIGSAAGTAILSRTWQPPSTSDFNSAASSFGITVASDVGTNVVREFWPDLKRRFRRN